MPDAILTLNAGSSSLKFSLYRRAKPDLTLNLKGLIEGIGQDPHLVIRDANRVVLTERFWRAGAGSHEDFLGGLLGWIDSHLGGARLVMVGHRVVHGGAALSSPILIDADAINMLEQLCPLAPLHQPHHLSAIRAVAALRPDLPQVACFDTAFHHGQPTLATRFALPRRFEADGVRRYGFHGLSYEYVSDRLKTLDPERAGGRVIAAHLGNGASLCGMIGGRSQESSMGFTALDGLMMGTRCGSLDPGVVLYLMQKEKLTALEIEDLLYRKSGLLGVSEISSDMRVLLASPDPRAAEAVDLFTYRIARETGAIVSILGGLDGLIFTAGIGEHAPEIRARICERLGWLGVALDDAANSRGETVISAPESRVTVWVIPTDEEVMIARNAATMLD